MFATIFAALLTAGANGIEFELDADRQTIDPGRSVVLTAVMKVPAGVKAVQPDLRDRVDGFSLVEDFAEAPRTAEDGRTVLTTIWKLVPEPCAEVYRIAPFVVYASPVLLSAREDDGALSFVAGPVYFEPPAARASVTGGMETDPQRDLPPLSWRLVGEFAAWAGVALAALAVLIALIRYVLRRVKEHRMSPIERAWVELDRLLGKGLPGRGRYKDFYVELTMVVRRYIQRKYGIKAPHLTTEEFLAEFRDEVGAKREKLREFLESADMVKFAGVAATPAMAEGATASARGYLEDDNREERK